MARGACSVKIKCRHGFFTFHEEKAGEISKFAYLFDLDLVPFRDAYTFESLVDAESYSLAGKLYLNLPAIKTFEGEPWEVLEENKFVYGLSLGALIPIETIIDPITVSKSDYYYLQTGLIQPGCLIGGKRVINYSAWYGWQAYSIKYTEIETDG